VEFTDDAVSIDKPLNDLDRLILEVTGVLEDTSVRYAVVSGYVAVLFGRARATEDIDVIVERFDSETASELTAALEDAGYWGSAMSLEACYQTLEDELPFRIAQQDHRVPNVELKFPTDEYDRASLANTITATLPEGSFAVGELELQIAYKLHMGTQKDREDAVYLYEVTEGTLNHSALERYVQALGVEDDYDRLR
jgi:hypothetical protein